MDADTQAPRVVPPSRRRDKPILSCSLCRRRKLKCDRQQPCKTCVDRGLSISCTYTRGNPISQEAKTSREPNSVHDRIDQLEKLVTSLMGAKHDAHGSPALSTSSLPHLESHNEEDSNEVPGNPDRVKFSGDTTSYTNSSHWTSILDGISDLREHLDQIPSSASSKDGNQGDIPGPDLLFGRQRHASKQELLAALPPRSEADQLFATYFASMDTAPTLLHRPTFLREYHEFWTRPFDASTMWLGLLFAVFALGARFQATFHGQESSPDSDPTLALWSARIDFYREKVVQCLILANYTKCPPYTVETCLMYFGTEFLRSADTQFPIFVMVGMIVRMAFRMGYHREPSKFPNISPFRAEMRRRTWLVILSLDLISSAQVGLPRMIQPFMYDTHEPRNLLDADIHETMVELPPSRPETELTQLLYSIILTRVRNVHAKIMDLMHTTSQPSYRETMDLDTVLRHVYDRIPESSKAMPAEDFEKVISPASMRRLYLGLSFLKAELMLHRPYLILARTDSRYGYSRRMCLNAAYEMLSFQRKLDSEIQPGGKLWSSGWQIFTVSWYMSSVVAQDFLLATTVLVADLDEDIVAPLQTTYETGESGLQLDRVPPARDDIITALRAAYEIWLKASKRSNEARKVAAAVKLVLAKAEAGNDAMADYTIQKIHAADQPELVSLLPDFDFNDFVAGVPSPHVFATSNNTYDNLSGLGDMPMDLSTFTEAFNWVGMPSELQMPYNQFSGHPNLQ